MTADPVNETILIADGDATARAQIADSLWFKGMQCEEVATARDAMRVALERRPSLLTLDIVLPDLSGFALCRMIREHAQLARMPIVFVSQQDSEEARVLALEAGADDFVGRPFHPPELAARVTSILRRLQQLPPEAVDPGSTQPIRIDVKRWRAVVRGRTVDLTPTELALLETLVSGAGRVVPRSELLERLGRGDVPVRERAVDAHVKNIRRKLGDACSLIETVRGIGYRYAEPGPAHER